MHRLIDTKQEQTLYYKQRLFLQGSGVRGAPEAREGVGGGGGLAQLLSTQVFGNEIAVDFVIPMRAFRLRTTALA